MRGRVLIMLSGVMALQGCYTLQAVRGQMELLAKREPVTEVMAREDTPDALRERLAYAQEVVAFASTELGLPDNGSYATYAELDRDFVLWNVVVTEEFSVEPMRWCAPIAGCVAYRGYFDRAAAERFADRHRSHGRDVSLGGVRAYSTLGWFRDPLLDSMFTGEPADLAAVLIHELAHQRLYIPGDSALSEAFATVVEIEGVTRWLRARDEEQALADWASRRVRQRAFTDTLMETRNALQDLYASGMAADRMRARKAELFEALRTRLGEERLRNNAELAAVATYQDLVPVLQRLLEMVDFDLEAFYARVERGDY
jgi:predicted aminopeptidase